MAVQLDVLYEEICPDFGVRLLTEGCFNKMIDWVHMVEGMDFIPLLHGEELVLNSGLGYISEEWLWTYIEALVEKNVGGLIIALRDGMYIPKEMIDYCNAIEFPVFSATWETPYIDIMRTFSGILLRNEQIETNLITALQNAIHFPGNEELFLPYFEKNEFYDEMEYNIVILSCDAYKTEQGNKKLEMIQKKIRYYIQKGIIYEEKGKLIILSAEESSKNIIDSFKKLCEMDHNVFAGVGTTVRKISEIYKSYNRAFTAYQLTKTAIAKNFLCYAELGIYKLLADQKEEEIYPEFVEETLGKLIAYDKENKTGYLEILQAFFENDCSIINTADMIYCHKNTLTYKLSKIKEVLGYDILTNENRMRIMISFRILKMSML